MTHEKIAEYTRRITMANKTQMITIIYEMVLEYIDEAGTAYEMEDEKTFGECLSRAMNCIDELIHSLDIRYELGNNLLSLYLFEKRQLMNSIGKYSIEMFPHVIKTFTNLHAAYLELEKMDDDKAVMSNVPKVYVGLTYGKGQLRETVQGNVLSRGYMA